MVPSSRVLSVELMPPALLEAKPGRLVKPDGGRTLAAERQRGRHIDAARLAALVVVLVEAEVQAGPDDVRALDDGTGCRATAAWSRRGTCAAC